MLLQGLLQRVRKMNRQQHQVQNLKRDELHQEIQGHHLDALHPSTFGRCRQKIDRNQNKQWYLEKEDAAEVAVDVVTKVRADCLKGAAHGHARGTDKAVGTDIHTAETMIEIDGETGEVANGIGMIMIIESCLQKEDVGPITTDTNRILAQSRVSGVQPKRSMPVVLITRMVRRLLFHMVSFLRLLLQ